MSFTMPQIRAYGSFLTSRCPASYIKQVCNLILLRKWQAATERPGQPELLQLYHHSKAGSRVVVIEKFRRCDEGRQEARWTQRWETIKKNGATEHRQDESSKLHQPIESWVEIIGVACWTSMPSERHLHPDTKPKSCLPHLIVCQPASVHPTV